MASLRSGANLFMKHRFDSILDVSLVSGFVGISIAEWNQWLTLIGLLIGIPIGIIRLMILWREWTKGNREKKERKQK